MILPNGHYYSEVDKAVNEKEIKELYRILKRENFPLSDYSIILHEINQMREELALSHSIEIKKLYSYFLELNELNLIFKNTINNYLRLNQIYIELRTVWDMLDYPKPFILHDLVENTNPFELMKLGLGKDSLLEKILLFRTLRDG
ncbi:hypothetical protein [Candidatus Hodarchaeum mangrovi]